MLFVDPKLHSKYDFGNEIDDASANIAALSKEIADKSTMIFNMLEKNIPIELFHHDINDKEMFVSNTLSPELYDRDYISIQNILYRKTKEPGDTHTAISFHLDAMGIKIPSKTSKEYKKYLQLLYFFYMLRYFVFQNENIFLILKEKRRSTYFVPNTRADGGNYWYFILCNLFDDEILAEGYAQRDICFSAAISLLANKLEQLISEKKHLDENLACAEKIRHLISEIAEIKPERPENEDSVEQMLDMAYQYQMLAYSGDMVKNLGEGKSPFCFKELEYEIDMTWKKILIMESEVDAFLKDRHIIEFCRQEEILDERPEKKARGNAFSFVKEVMAYDQELEDNGQQRLFTKSSNGNVFIQKDLLAIIVKTYLDCEEDMKMIFPSGEDWKQKQRLQRALASKQTAVTDLAMRLFVVAFHSEYLNVYAGHGYYYPLFKCIYLAHYLLLQEMVYAVFMGEDRGIWARRMYFLLDNL